MSSVQLTELAAKGCRQCLASEPRAAEQKGHVSPVEPPRVAAVTGAEPRVLGRHGRSVSLGI